MSRTSTLFHARAAGLSGQLNGKVLDVQAPSTLANFGGRCSNSVSSVQHESLQCGPISSSTTGSYNPATKTSEIDIACSVEKLRLGDVVSANLYLKLHISYIPNSSQQPSIVPAGSRMDLTIHGQPVEIESLVDSFTELDTLDKIRERHQKDKKFREKMHEACMVARFDELERLGLAQYFPFCQGTTSDVLKESRYGATLPLFRATASGKGFQACQNTIAIEGFGRLQLGSWSSRQVNGTSRACISIWIRIPSWILAAPAYTPPNCVAQPSILVATVAIV